MKVTNGRLEREVKELNKINSKLTRLPEVIQNYYYYLEAADKTYSTIEKYINYVENFMNYCMQSGYDEYFYKNVTSATINEYMSSIKYKTNASGKVVKVGNGIRATRWSALNTFFAYLKMTQLIDNNPMDQTLRPSCKQDREVTFLSESEIKKCIKSIYKNCNEKFINRDVCIFSLGISTGLRVSAITQINLEDIDFNNNTIQVIEKGNKYRVINFGENLREKLIAWIEDRNTYFSDVDTDALFISKKRNRISVDAVEDMVEKYTKCIDKHITPHKLRATCATNLYKKTRDIYIVANQLGHANISTTEIYTKIDDESKRQATDALDKLI